MTKPWTYLSLKAVFEHVDVNKRFKIKSHCPTLRHIEKEVPLRLKYLSFRKNEIQLNTTTIKRTSYKNKAGKK
ncbi:hypothetical protein CRE_09617 [Caenorhabditis remanei]|nr:hypothetical protein CRE_09617 [Caenorhabditis remanei]